MREPPSERLDGRITSVWRADSLIGTGFCALATFGPVVPLVHFGVIGERWFLLPVCVMLFWRVPSFFIFPRIRYARWRYEILPDEIDVMEGLFFITRTVVPMIRVQYTDTSQGPVMRAFGLASVTVFTAGGRVEIPGLTPEDADAMRDRIAALAKIAKEDV